MSFEVNGELRRRVKFVLMVVSLSVLSACASAVEADVQKPTDVTSVLSARTIAEKADDEKLTKRYDELFRHQEKAWNRVEELAKSSIVNGKTTDEKIQHLFGKPPVIYFPGNRTQEYHYLFLNMDGSCTSEYFKVYFDSDNKVKGWALGSGDWDL